MQKQKQKQKKRNRPNPNNRPVTQEQIHRAAEKAKDKATNTAWAIFFSVLYDKHGFEQENLSAVWHETTRIAKMEESSEINLPDIVKDLERYSGVNLRLSQFTMPDRPTEADLKRAEKWAVQLTENVAWAFMLTALKNVENPGGELLRKVYGEMLYLRESIDKGYIRPKHLHMALAEEAKIIFE